MRIRTLAAVIVSLVFVLVSLAGCGQKGPLVLPKSLTAATTLR
jgi:predicted small lipoprotein YifL